MNIAGLQLIDGYRIMRATSRRHIIVRLMTPPTNPSSAGRNKAKRMMSTTEIYALRTAYDRRRLVWINYQRHAEFFFLSLSLPSPVAVSKCIAGHLTPSRKLAARVRMWTTTRLPLAHRRFTVVSVTRWSRLGHSGSTQRQKGVQGVLVICNVVW